MKGYDYSSAGYYFVTICVKGGHEILGKAVGSGFHARPNIELTEIGLELLKIIEYVGNENEAVRIPKFVIMPNHVHIIVALTSVGRGSPTLHSVVGRIKSFAAKRWSEICDEKFQTFWQTRFHDHIIRNEEDYLRIWKYIDENPAKWTHDEYFARNKSLKF